MGDSTELNSGRAATVTWPREDDLVFNHVVYRFGHDSEATRADRVMRSPTCALLIQRRGGLYERIPGQGRSPLPRIAFLGPTPSGHLWETEPGTEFVLVNLAPGASRRLLDHLPTELRQYIEDLDGHPLQQRLDELGSGDPRSLHTLLRQFCAEQGAIACDHDQLTRQATAAMRAHACGNRAEDYAEALGISLRSLQRATKSTLGLTPKQILSVERIRRLVVLTDDGWHQGIAALAQAGGYFDQSHLRHELIRRNYGDAGELLGGGHIITQR